MMKKQYGARMHTENKFELDVTSFKIAEMLQNQSIGLENQISLVYCKYWILPLDDKVVFQSTESEVIQRVTSIWVSSFEAIQT